MITEKAKLFALQAHMGQVRKNEKDKPMIMHPFLVAGILATYGFDENVISAGYLHDVVEDTPYTIDDIKKEFGDDIADLVMGDTEPDKLLSWNERKQYTIDSCQNLSFRHKAVICADKIANLEDMYLKFEKQGIRDFSVFKEGEDKQRWYYTSVYESLIKNEDKDLPIFQRLKEVLDKLFYAKEDIYLKDTIYKDNPEFYASLKKLHAQKLELQKLKSLVSLPKPFVIEFTGTPRNGKTTTIHNLLDFFKKGGFTVSLVEEFTTSKYYKENLKSKFADLSHADRDLAIVEEVAKQLKEAIATKKDVILIDRSLNDRQIWNYRRFLRGDVPEDKYEKAKEKYAAISKDLIDFLVVTYADPLTALKRDYYTNLALEPRSFLNEDNLTEYNNSLKALQSLFASSVNDMLFLDTSMINLNDISEEVAAAIMPVMRQKYITEFKKEYKLKSKIKN